MAPQTDNQLIAIAEAFEGVAAVAAVEPLGSGNINDTYKVLSSRGTTVLQRLNSRVFTRPDLVMHNMQVLGEHVEAKLASTPQPWHIPRVVPTCDTRGALHTTDSGDVWRMITFVPESHSVDVVVDAQQARELGIGLGVFHQLINDLPPSRLADTLEGFHITPGYLPAYRRALVNTTVEPCEASEHCLAFIRDREGDCDVLERAKERGELPLRPIHGDPKINNVMLDRRSGRAIALIDLDTVKPGLVHYDIGDCLRSCCNRLGEETSDHQNVEFDLELADAILAGYLSVAGSFLSAAERRYIPDAARLISFELGMRFFSDYLQGNIYFQANYPQHNLRRAMVQFQLTTSIEAQLPQLRHLVDRHAKAVSI